ncbi:MAG: Ig-like domain repeat protein [bacterium]|nr:Ig-like domain repeat protein [bacterium]
MRNEKSMFQHFNNLFAAKNSLWLVALALALAGTRMASADVQKTAQYTLDTTTMNAGSGSGLDLGVTSVSGSPVYATGVNGIGQALDFSALNGAHSAAARTGGNATALNGANAVTITGWIKLDSADTYAGLERLLATADSGGSGGVVLGVYGAASGNGANKGMLEMNLAGASGMSIKSAAVYTTANVWLFFAVTWVTSSTQPANNVSFYAGTESAGVSLVNTTTFAGDAAALPTQGTLAVGNRPGLARGFDGAVDDLRIYTSTSAQILTTNQLELVRQEALSVPIPPPPTPTNHVVILVMDGARYSETWGDPTHTNIPQIATNLALRGVVLTNLYTDICSAIPGALTETGPGHATLACGTYQNIDNFGTQLPYEPTIFQYYRQQHAAPARAAWVVTSKDKIVVVTDTSKAGWNGLYRPSYNCGVNGVGGGGYREDNLTHPLVIAALTNDHPAVMLINYKGPDAMGHLNNWAGYLAAIKEVDGYAADVWATIQADPQLKDATTLFIVTDHGRHDDAHGGIVYHGDGCEGCTHLLGVALGPSFKTNLISGTRRTQPDLATTAANLLGIAMPTATGQIISELYGLPLTATMLGSSRNPSTNGNSVTFTATVQTNGITATAATGTVTFKDGGTVLDTVTLSGGVATYASSALAVGSHALTAVYGGDTNYTGSSSGVLNQTVYSAMVTPTTITLASSANPSGYGNRVTLTATVTPATATGPVTFKDGATTLGTGTLSGSVATYATSTLPAGLHILTAVYDGDFNYLGSSSTNYAQTVNPKALTVTGITANDKEYDGTPAASLNIANLVPAAVITPIAASATSIMQGQSPSSYYSGSDNIWNGSNMNKPGGEAGILTWTHLTDPYGGGMWVSGYDPHASITVNLGAVYTLSTIYLWNCTIIGPDANRDVLTLDVRTSSDGTNFSATTSLNLTAALTVEPTQALPLPAGNAKYVKLTSTSVNGGDAAALSAVRFYLWRGRQRQSPVAGGRAAGGCRPRDAGDQQRDRRVCRSAGGRGQNRDGVRTVPRRHGGGQLRGDAADHHSEHHSRAGGVAVAADAAGFRIQRKMALMQSHFVQNELRQFIFIAVTLVLETHGTYANLAALARAHAH